MYILVFYGKDVPISEEDTQLSGSPVGGHDLQKLTQGGKIGVKKLTVYKSFDPTA